MKYEGHRYFRSKGLWVEIDEVLFKIAQTCVVFFIKRLILLSYAYILLREVQ